MSGFDDHLLEKSLQFPLKKENNAFLIDILELLMDSKELKQGYLRLHFMRDFFTFCPVCISVLNSGPIDRKKWSSYGTCQFL